MPEFDRALAHHRAGRLAEAAAGYRRILEAEPEHADARHLLGVTLHQRGQHELAAAMIEQAIDRDPDVANYRNSLGLALRGLGQIDAALDAWRLAATLDPQDADICNNLGLGLTDLRRYGEAEDALRRALALRPDFPAAMNNLGRVLVWKGAYDAAAELLRRACEAESENATYWNSLGVALREGGDYDAALDAFGCALRIAPELADAHVNRGQIYLLRGDFDEGWRENEWRLRHPRHAGRDRGRSWSGEDVSGRTVLLWAEQGYGDAIQFIRYAPLVAARGARVVVECRAALHRLFGGIAGVAACTVPDAVPEYDRQAALMSLPAILQQAPAPGRYIAPPAGSGSPESGANRRIGLVWAGHPDHANDRARSYKLREFAALASPGNSFVALQAGPAARDAAPDGMVVERLGGSFADFADTAAAIMTMDLVISVDTAVAHLAGALGRPVWVILPPNPDWRWGLTGETSRWYASMRLFRRQRGEDRAAVIGRVAKALTGL